MYVLEEENRILREENERLTNDLDYILTQVYKYDYRRYNQLDYERFINRIESYTKKIGLMKVFYLDGIQYLE